MTSQSTIKKALFAAALGAGVTAMAVPVQAGSLERGLWAGLLGGVVLGTLAASAQAQQGGPALAAVPPDLDVPVYMDEIGREVRPLPRRTARPQQRRVSPRPSPVLRTSAEITKCGEAIETRVRPFGAVDVKVSSAGSQVRSRDGAIVLPVDARIEYARKGLRQVRRARVGCHMNTDGQVVELR
jgi:hypothetical protein